MLPENPAATFGWWLRVQYVTMKTGSRETGERWLLDNRGPPAALRHKAPVGSSSSLDSQVDAQTVLGPFTDSLRTTSAFMKILLDGGFWRLNFWERLAVMTSDPTAAVVSPGAAIPLSRTMFGNVLLEPLDVGSMASFTDTLMRDISSNGQQVLNRVVRSIVGARNRPRDV